MISTIHWHRQFDRHSCLNLQRPVQAFNLTARRALSSTNEPPNGPEIDESQTPNLDQPPVPPYKPRVGETLEVQKARIVYQSRKRGMLENDLLLRYNQK